MCSKTPEDPTTSPYKCLAVLVYVVRLRRILLTTSPLSYSMILLDPPVCPEDPLIQSLLINHSVDPPVCPEDPRLQSLLINHSVDPPVCPEDPLIQSLLINHSVDPPVCPEDPLLQSLLINHSVDPPVCPEDPLIQSLLINHSVTVDPPVSGGSPTPCGCLFVY